MLVNFGTDCSKALVNTSSNKLAWQERTKYSFRHTPMYPVVFRGSLPRWIDIVIVLFSTKGAMSELNPCHT